MKSSMKNLRGDADPSSSSYARLNIGFSDFPPFSFHLSRFYFPLTQFGIPHIDSYFFSTYFDLIFLVFCSFFFSYRRVPFSLRFVFVLIVSSVCSLSYKISESSQGFHPFLTIILCSFIVPLFRNSGRVRTDGQNHDFRVSFIKQMRTRPTKLHRIARKRGKPWELSLFTFHKLILHKQIQNKTSPMPPTLHHISIGSFPV